MNREIKFRAIIPVNSNEPKTMQHFDLSKIDDCNKFANADYDANKLMQYTGLKDKNGNEIYEGDCFNIHRTPSFVEYDNTNGMYILKRKDGIEATFFEVNMNRFEIIGNIYENPELLK